MPPRRCIRNGCRAWAVPGSSACAQHGGVGKGGWKGSPQMPPGWSTRRAKHLAWEPNCRVCGAQAVTVDHIVPRKHGGGEEDSNLRSLCALHAERKLLEDQRRGRMIAKRRSEIKKRIFDG